jgi:Flp pilus assembly protein TadG
MDTLLRKLVRSDQGTSAIEFALVSPALMLFIVGTVYLFGALFVTGSLHYAVEESARCRAIKTNVCPSSDTTVTYANGVFNGLGFVTPTFTVSNPSCGYMVVGTANFVFDFGLSSTTYPITATSCYP